jgi:hypothetical protein
MGERCSADTLDFEICVWEMCGHDCWKEFIVAENVVGNEI